MAVTIIVDSGQAVKPVDDVRKQPLASCGICMECFRVDEVVRMDKCPHTFCKACLVQYVTAEIR